MEYHTLRTVALLLAALGAAHSQVIPNCKYTLEALNTAGQRVQYCFLFETATATFSSARDTCLARQGTLAIDQYQSIHTLLQVAMSQERITEAWIGAEETVGAWGFVNGDPLANYNNWDAGEPSSQGNCASMVPSSWKWRAQQCVFTLNYICERVTALCQTNDNVKKEFTYNGKCYSIHFNQLNWLQAEGSCKSEAGSLVGLVSITDTALQQQISAQLATVNLVANRINGFWIGLTKTTWRWVDQTKVANSFWESSNPVAGAGQCMSLKQFIPNNTPEWLWTNAECTSSKLAICQIENIVYPATTGRPRFTTPGAAAIVGFTTPSVLTTPTVSTAAPTPAFATNPTVRFVTPPAFTTPSTTTLGTTGEATTVAATTVAATTAAATTVAATTVAATTAAGTTAGATTAAGTTAETGTTAEDTTAVAPTKGVTTIAATATMAMAAVTTGAVTTAAVTTVPVTTVPVTTVPVTTGAPTTPTSTVLTTPSSTISTSTTPSFTTPTAPTTPTTTPSFTTPTSTLRPTTPTAAQTTASQTTASQTTASQTTASQTTASQTTVGPTTAVGTTVGPTTAAFTTPAAPTTPTTTPSFTTPTSTLRPTTPTAPPTTAAQTTASQTTASQTTASQTTVGPTTAVDTTVGPTTASDTTVSPTIEATTTEGETTPEITTVPTAFTTPVSTTRFTTPSTTRFTTPTAAPKTCSCQRLQVSGPEKPHAASLGFYSLQTCDHNGRNVYKHDQRELYLYYSVSNSWAIGLQLDQGAAYLRVNDSAVLPTDVNTTWSVLTELTGSTYQEDASVNISCACGAIQCQTVEMRSPQASTLIRGQFVRRGESNGRPYYENTQQGLFLYLQQTSTCTYWAVGATKDSSTPLMVANDVALTPEEISATWNVHFKTPTRDEWSRDTNIRLVCLSRST